MPKIGLGYEVQSFIPSHIKHVSTLVVRTNDSLKRRTIVLNSPRGVP